MFFQNDGKVTIEGGENLNYVKQVLMNCPAALVDVPDGYDITEKIEEAQNAAELMGAMGFFIDEDDVNEDGGVEDARMVYVKREIPDEEYNAKMLVMAKIAKEAHFDVGMGNQEAAALFTCDIKDGKLSLAAKASDDDFDLDDIIDLGDDEDELPF